MILAHSSKNASPVAWCRLERADNCMSWYHPGLKAGMWCRLCCQTSAEPPLHCELHDREGPDRGMIAIGNVVLRCTQADSHETDFGLYSIILLPTFGPASDGEVVAVCPAGGSGQEGLCPSYGFLVSHHPGNKGPTILYI